MGLDEEVVQGLSSEDIVSPLDLAKFEKEQIEMLVKNLRKPKGYRMLHLDQDYADEVMTIPNPGFKVGTKSKQRMLVSSDLMRFYVTKNRDLTVDKIRWTPTIMDFKHQWEALEKKAKATADPPKIAKKFIIM